MSHGSAVAQDAVEPPALAQLDGGNARRGNQAAASQGRKREAHRRAWRYRRRLPVHHQRDGCVEVVGGNVQRTGDVGAAEAQLTGPAKHVRQCARRAEDERRPAGLGGPDLGAVPEADGEGPLRQRPGEFTAQGGSLREHPRHRNVHGAVANRKRHRLQLLADRSRHPAQPGRARGLQRSQVRRRLHR